MKKALLLTSLIGSLISDVAWAGGSYSSGYNGTYNSTTREADYNSYDKDSSLSGFYVSGRAGYGAAYFKNTTDNYFVLGTKPHAHSGVFGLSVGYQHSFMINWMAGLELEANYHDHDKGMSHGNKYERLKSKYSFGIDSKLGYIFGLCTIYGKLGVEWTNLSHKKSIGNSSSKKTRTHTGFAIGLGFEKEMTDRVSIGGEIKHIFYERKRYVHEGVGVAGVHKIRPQFTRLLATVSYKF